MGVFGEIGDRGEMDVQGEMDNQGEMGCFGKIGGCGENACWGKMGGWDYIGGQYEMDDWSEIQSQFNQMMYNHQQIIVDNEDLKLDFGQILFQLQLFANEKLLNTNYRDYLISKLEKILDEDD